MPLPTPSLDDRRFQDIVDEAKSLIPRFCPEWTDHNVSDPGVALIELFAWMTDLLLYRVNQVPDKIYVKFLELIGVRLEPPRPARAPITFYLSAPQPGVVTIPIETEVATLRTETSPAIVFTTESDLVIRPPKVTGAFTRDADKPSGEDWAAHDLAQLTLPGQRIAIFPSQPAPGDAFYVALEEDHSHHILTLVLQCETAGGAGVDPTRPPIEWQVWQGGITRWAKCELEYDSTGGFNQSGEIVLHAPAMEKGMFQERTGYWLRCRLTNDQAGKNAYRQSPDVESLRVESRGGTVHARNATTVVNEYLGRSQGTPGEAFNLLHTPLLARDPQRDHLLVERPGGEVEQWAEVSDFADSRPQDRHYTLDSLDGTLTLGPSVLQPDGAVYQFGAIPERGSTLRFKRYQSGGGVAGNVPRAALVVIKSSVPYVARTINRQEAVGGRDAQTLEDAKLRAPQVLRTRTRAVTADDFTYLACQVPGVARAHCLAPGPSLGQADEPKPGHVTVVVLPEASVGTGRVSPDSLTLSAELRAAVLTYLDARRLIGSSLDVIAPQYVFVSVEARLRLADGSDPTLAAEAQRMAEDALYRYLDPYRGGPHRDGWPFGRDLNLSELYGLLHQISGVEYVEQVGFRQIQEPRDTALETQRISVPGSGIICSDRHTITVVM